MRWLSLVCWIVACLAVGAIGGRWTGPEIPGWYRTLRKPSFNPPSWVFAPVWTTLYVLMAIAVWLITEFEPSPVRSVALILFAIQLTLNLAWSWIFFHLHAIGPAAVEVIVLWCAICASMVAFSQLSPVAEWLMAPYLAWTTFASILNVTIWRLNPSAG